MYINKMYIPSLKQVWGFKPINTSMQKDVCKSLLVQEEDYDTFINTINQVIHSCTEDKFKSKIDSLTLIDKLIICLHLRCISIGSSIELEIEKDSKKYKLMYDFAQKIDSIIQVADEIEPLIITAAELEIKCNIPSIYNEKDLIYILQDEVATYNSLSLYFIEYIKISKNIFYLKDLNSSDREKLLESLPVHVVRDVITFAVKTIETFQQLLIHSFFETQIGLYIIGKSYTEYLKYILDGNLYNIYQEIYILSKHANIDATYVDNLTSLERSMYISFIHKENEASSQPEEPSNSSDMPMPALDPIRSLDAFQQEMGG